MYGLYPLGLLAGILFFFVVDYIDRDEKVNPRPNSEVKNPEVSEDP